MSSSIWGIREAALTCPTSPLAWAAAEEISPLRFRPLEAALACPASPLVFSFAAGVEHGAAVLRAEGEGTHTGAGGVGGADDGGGALWLCLALRALRTSPVFSVLSVLSGSGAKTPSDGVFASSDGVFASSDDAITPSDGVFASSDGVFASSDDAKTPSDAPSGFNRTAGLAGVRLSGLPVATFF